ncbi:acetyl-CoA carboxylase biotin carboxylase subunit [Pseudovibrio exalbescens]|uniref:acetyl-CoA carboxylase biotin carboxylase subunit n=1 Tax=Pseudovibrio exalbescens TaxID=197461 RepID=UPI0023672E92|nr:acetyl-CoA carboxylase biotin carboxylase subunit [Pseudovibrio exalbescens]MDD7910658.1 acetyl-CoA carboxylase biotin carboxylase subunit [Pseudovibrio exalbescens]
MFSKILIANRGEIACRVIRSAKAMGIKTVAVFSEADKDALHVELADEAVHIGPAPAADSYLVADKIIEACRQTGAQAVHPGYGFLSERAAFAAALKEAGITFIGPNPRAIEAMGDKITSKKFAADAGVSTVPGNMGLIETPEDAVRIAAEIGFPVMIKASAGGGGKGMRIAWSEEEAAEGFSRAKSEAASSFGDDRIFIEKFIENPRHIEIQVLGDKHGNVIYLGERECSIQRRNQKVIEEAPSPLLDEDTRRKMGEQAVALAKAVDYDSAGTVEFVAGQDKSFYFLEMNTRLQVEHPVTELITGVDLVEQMIRVAAGEKLEISQEDVKLNGWAVESRIYAEDPFRKFLPSIGRLTRYRPPQEGTFGDVIVRNDTGVVEGSEITMFYDPMIAKLVTHAPTRDQAIEAMSSALDEFLVDGIQHNVPFLASLMKHERWRSGELSTSFIADEYPDGFAVTEVDEKARNVLASVALSMHLIERERLDHLPGRLRPHSGHTRPHWVVKVDGTPVPVELHDGLPATPIHMDVSVGADGDVRTVRSQWAPGDLIWKGRYGNEDISVQVRPVLNGYRLDWAGYSAVLQVLPPRVAELDALMPEKVAPDTSKLLLCPMPGLVVSINVAEGQKVEAGDQLAIVEAMKMENVLRAERDCVVSAIKAAPGDSLAVDAVIMEFE